MEASVEYSVRYLPDRFLPDKAIDLIDEEASAYWQYESSEMKALETSIHEYEQLKMRLSHQNLRMRLILEIKKENLEKS